MSNDDNQPRELGKVGEHAFDRIGSDRLTDEERTQIEDRVRLACCGV